MKRIISIAALLLLALSVRAATNWLVWEKSASTNVTHYWITIGTNAPIVVQAPATNYALVTFGGTNISAFVRAVIVFVNGGFTNSTSSDPSPTLNFEVPPPPAKLRLQGSIESASSPAGPWQMETNTVLLVDIADERFYRLKGSIFR